LQEAAEVKHTVREYLSELEQENGSGEPPAHQQDHVSTTDPDATYASKGCMAASLGYFDNYLVDNHSCVIVDVEATAARLSQESVAARDMITRFTERRGRPPQTVAADTTYGNGEMLDWLEQHSITGHIRVKESPFVNNGLYDVEQFTYRPENNTYICPQGKQLTYVGINARNRTHVYASTPKRCRDCSRKAQCTRGQTRILSDPCLCRR
jgi:DDE family transposase